ncbi:hypothetical protein TNIN_309611 [Trichonephila inaurata madagascariensis]|uniref:Uncharacterized protein n=1 Tax=Trichonephila inaurata madagascariensis TaxID=2747483 RepID=A0A8X7C4B7_9ARAC|nr:hypothetical protein TNIN_309611 [Trichonephila inaurata madagascariensis]
MRGLRQEEPSLVQPAADKFNLIELIPNYESSESIGIRRFLNKINDVAELGKWSNSEKVTIMSFVCVTLCQGNFRCIGSSLLHERNPLQDSDLTGIPLQGRVRLWSHCISNTKDCDSTLQIGFAPLEEPLQDSEPTGLPLQGRLLHGATASL